jgi:hypothetical protein
MNDVARRSIHGRLRLSKPVILSYGTLKSGEKWPSYRRKSGFQTVGSAGEQRNGHTARQFTPRTFGAQRARHFDISHVEIDSQMPELCSGKSI